MTQTAPASTYVLVSSIIATFCAFGTVVIFLPRWEWYLIPIACFLPTLAVLAQRWMKRQRMQRELRSTLEQLG